MRFSASIRCFVSDTASHVGGGRSGLNLFSSRLYEQPEHFAAVKALTVTSHKPFANLPVRVNMEGTENKLCLGAVLIKPSDASQYLLQTAVFPTVYWFWCMSRGHGIISHSYGKNKCLTISFLKDTHCKSDC